MSTIDKNYEFGESIPLLQEQKYVDTMDTIINAIETLNLLRSNMLAISLPRSKDGQAGANLEYLPEGTFPPLTDSEIHLLQTIWNDVGDSVRQIDKQMELLGVKSKKMSWLDKLAIDSTALITDRQNDSAYR